MEDLTRRRLRWAVRLRWAAVVAWAGVIFALSSIPAQALPPEAGIVGVDKLAHAVVFGVLGFLVARASGRGGGRALVLAALCASAYGLLDEIHQRWTPGRDSSFWDFLADTIGGAAGAAAYLLLARRRVDADHP
jgi:VanZ family protein